MSKSKTIKQTYRLNEQVLRIHRQSCTMSKNHRNHRVETNDTKTNIPYEPNNDD